MKKIIALLMVLVMVFALAACGQKGAGSSSAAPKIRIGMVTDVGGVND